MVLFYKIWKKYNEIQLTKNKMDLNNRKLQIIHLPAGLELLIKKFEMHAASKQRITL